MVTNAMMDFICYYGFFNARKIGNFKVSKGAKIIFLERGSCMVWEINMGVCPRLDLENIMLFNCLGYTFYIYGAFEFLCNSIANL